MKYLQGAPRGARRLRCRRASVRLPDAEGARRRLRRSAYAKGSGDKAPSTTMVFVDMLGRLLHDQDLGKCVVPIIPDEARTFGMDPFFASYKIYSNVGQLYEPVDAEFQAAAYREAKDGQLLEEGITEAGSMSSFIAAGTAYATHGVPTIPFYIYYSMFGFQRIGDLIWAAADLRTRGFLLGATAGRTTLNGEGLQHEDGHSHVLASTVPNLVAYDPAFAFELAVIIRDGIRRMYEDVKEDVFYYITLYNDNYPMLPMPDGVDGGHPQGPVQAAAGGRRRGEGVPQGPPVRQRPDPACTRCGRRRCWPSSSAWRPTSGARRATRSCGARRWRSSAGTCCTRRRSRGRATCETVLAKEEGVFLAASDYMRSVPEMIARWVPGGLFPLGTDGFGRSETRAALRRHFEVDAECITVAALCAAGASRRGQAGGRAAGDSEVRHQSGKDQPDAGVSEQVRPSLRVCSRRAVFGRARLRPSRKPQKNRLGGSLALPKPDPLEQTLISEAVALVGVSDASQKRRQPSQRFCEASLTPTPLIKPENAKRTPTTVANEIKLEAE